MIQTEWQIAPVVMKSENCVSVLGFVQPFHCHFYDYKHEVCMMLLAAGRLYPSEGQYVFVVFPAMHACSV